MTTPDTSPFEGLSEDELASYSAESGIKPGESHDDWTARSRRLAEDYQAKAAARREASTGETPEAEEMATAGEPEAETPPAAPEASTTP